MNSPSVNTEILPKDDPKRKPRNSTDPGWKYAFWPNLDKRDLVECSLCARQMTGGIKRIKQHLAGGFGDITICSKTTTELRRQMLEYILSKKKTKVSLDFDDGEDGDENDADQEHDVQELHSSVGDSNFVKMPSSGTATKQKKKATSILNFVTPKPPANKGKSIVQMLRKSPEEVIKDRHDKHKTQTTIESYTKTAEEKDRVFMHIADFFYENGIPFNAAHSLSYEIMIESVGQYGPGLKPPSYHELRVPLLEKAKKNTEKLRADHERAWERFGCSIMADGWTDRRQRHLINFLVNSPQGTFFLGSVNASDKSHDAVMLADLLEIRIREIGIHNVVQVISDNGANYKAAGQLLERRFPGLWWTPCAAHCINLMMEEIGGIKQFKKVIGNAKRITTFIYRHGRILDFMREKTGQRELVRPGATRFATAFLTLQCLYNFKDDLRLVFISGDWTKSLLSKTLNGRKVESFVLSVAFWNGVYDCIVASKPLLLALRLVDGDEQPALPDIMYVMEQAKDTVSKIFKDRKRLEQKLVGIIKRRWDNQMGTKLYGAGLFLNPGKFFDIQSNNPDYATTLREDFNDVLEHMVSDRELRATISDQVDEYENSRNSFARETLFDLRKKKRPLDWWSGYAGRTKELQKFAKRIVGLCCSSSGCERNWSTFEFIHTKRKNRLEWKRLNDLVYVQYNRKIATRFEKLRRSEKGYNPLVIEDFQWENEWVADDPLWVHVDEVNGASNANQPRNVRKAARGTDYVYSRRRNRDDDDEASRMQEESNFNVQNESDSEPEDVDVELDDGNIPIDDEEVDDFGEPSSAHESVGHTGSGSYVREDLVLEDFT